MSFSILLSVLLALPAMVAQAGPPPSPAPLVPFHIDINASTLAGLPRRTISATDEHGTTNSYSGVALHDLLVRQGVPTNMAVRGRAMMAYVVVGAADNYHVLFTLPELDPSYTDRVTLIAESRDGQPFTGSAGPYRLIVPGEKREARWVRQVTEVNFEVITLGAARRRPL
jgi:hypothetical protein